MFNAGQQIGGAVGLAVIGSVAWTVVNKHVRDSLTHVEAGHNIAGHVVAGPVSPIYDHALSGGVTTALTMGAGATVLALIITVIAIRVRRQDLPDPENNLAGPHRSRAVPRDRPVHCAARKASSASPGVS